MKNIIAATVAGLVMFFWGFVSWTMIPWHTTDVHKFADEQAVMSTMLENAPASGIYFIPGENEELEMGKPGAMVNVMKTGFEAGMVQMMVQAIVASVVMAYLAIWLLGKTTLRATGQKVGFITVLGFLIGLSSAFMYWNWMGYPLGYSVVNLLDTTVTWLLAGLVIAKMADTPV